MSSELFLAVSHNITETKNVAYQCFRMPKDATVEDMATVIDLFKEEELGRPLGDVKHSFTYHIETKEDRGGGGGKAWPLED